MGEASSRAGARITRVVLVLGVLFGLATLAGSLYYAVGMDSDSERLFRLAQISCFTTEGAESVERCAPLTRATADGQALTFVSVIGIVSWVVVLGVASLSLWLLVSRLRPANRAKPLIPRWAAWVFLPSSVWLLVSLLDKLWDEEYAEGVSDPVTGVLSQYFPALMGQTSARVWLGSTDALYAATGRLLGQAFVLWAVALFVLSVIHAGTSSASIGADQT